MNAHVARRCVVSLAAVVMVLAASNVLPAQEDAVDRTREAIGYYIGLSFGQQASRDGFRTSDLDLQWLLKGLNDGLEKKAPQIDEQQLTEARTKIQTLIRERRAEILAAAKKRGDEFLAANANKEGVKVMDSGVQYKVLTAGTGPSPERLDQVKVHYTGRLTDGTVFDSSVKRGQPFTVQVNKVIPGWEIALQEMKVGSKWMLYIPSDLAYGPSGSPPIGPNEVLIFEVELLEIL